MKQTKLSIQQYELAVFLGWSQQERQRKQTIFLDIEIEFPTPPRACNTDELEDTYCYDQLTQLLTQKITKEKFHLVEHLSCEIYKIVKAFFPKKSRVTIHLTKYPKIKGLKAGVRFSYGDKS